MKIDTEKLKQFREGRALSQRELACTADLTQVTVWRLENSLGEAPQRTICKLAEVLGVEPRELVKKGV